MLALLKKIWKPGLKLIFLLAVIAFGLWVAEVAKENSAIRELVSSYGYFGIFVVAVISGFNLAVPVPAASFIPVFVASGLNPWLAVAIITVGVTLSDFLAFLIGKTGRHLATAAGKNSFAYLEKMRERHSWKPVAILYLFAAFAPIPNELFVIPLALAGYKITHLLPALILGNATFNILATLGIMNFPRVF